MASTLASVALLLLGGLATLAGGLAVVSLADGDTRSSLVFGSVLLSIAVVSLVLDHADPTTG